MKVNPRLLGSGVVDADPINLAIAGVPARSLCPTVNGVAVNPSVIAGLPVSFGWTLLDPIGDIASERITLSVATILEFLDGAGNVLGTLSAGAGETSLTVTPTEMAALVDGGQSFVLRIKSRFISADFTLDSNPEMVAVGWVLPTVQNVAFSSESMVFSGAYVGGRYRWPRAVTLLTASVVCAPALGVVDFTLEVNGVLTGLIFSIAAGVGSAELDLASTAVPAGQYVRWKCTAAPSSDSASQICITTNLTI